MAHGRREYRFESGTRDLSQRRSVGTRNECSDSNHVQRAEAKQLLAAPDGERALVEGLLRDDASREALAATASWPLALSVLVIGMFMSVLDVSIVNVAVPAIQREFGTTSEDIQWITTAYSLALGVIMPASSWLGDRFGLDRIYLVSLLGFSVVSILCGLAWDLGSMVVFRVIQAIPGGILPVASLTMVYRIVPKDKIGVAMGFYGLGIVFAPAIGPTLGGYLVEYVSWRMIFLVNVPVGLLGGLLCYLLVPSIPRSAVAPKFDTLGFLAVAAGLFALLLAFSEGQDWGWTSYPILLLLAFAVQSLAVFVVIELEVDHPLLDVRVFRIWSFANSLLLITILSIGLFAVLFYIPLFLQEGQGITPLHVGLLLLPEAVAMGFIMPLAGLISDKVGPRWPAFIGLSIAAYGTYLLCGVNIDMTQRDVVIWTLVRGVGNGLAMTSVMTAGLAMVPPERLTEAGAINNLVQRVAAALGLPVLTALATAQQAQLMADRTALLSEGGPQAPAILNLVIRQGISGLYPLYRRTQLSAMASAYSDVFIVTAVATGVGALLALMLKKPLPTEPEVDLDS